MARQSVPLFGKRWGSLTFAYDRIIRIVPLCQKVPELPSQQESTYETASYRQRPIRPVFFRPVAGDSYHCLDRRETRIHLTPIELPDLDDRPTLPVAASQFAAEPASRKLLDLQILRALAASLVVADHVVGAVSGVGVPADIFRQPGHLMGHLGVITFFVLSGLIMVRQSSALFAVPGGALRFAYRRIVPMYWIATVLLGDASYSTYLFHLFCYLPLVAVVMKFWGHHPANRPFIVAVMIVSVALANLLGLAIHRYIERPITRAIRKLNLPYSDSRRPAA